MDSCGCSTSGRHYTSGCEPFEGHARALPRLIPCRLRKCKASARQLHRLLCSASASATSQQPDKGNSMGLSDNQRAGDMKTAASNYDRSAAAAAWIGCGMHCLHKSPMAVHLFVAVMSQWTMTGCKPCLTTSAS